MAVRRQVTTRLVRRYSKATRAEKSAILDDLSEVNGWHRDHARKALRLAPAMPVLVDALRRHGELDITDQVAEQLVAMSAASSRGFTGGGAATGGSGPAPHRAGASLPTPPFGCACVACHPSTPYATQIWVA